MELVSREVFIKNMPPIKNFKLIISHQVIHHPKSIVKNISLLTIQSLLQLAPQTSQQYTDRNAKQNIVTVKRSKLN